eukprot:5748181-Amphidinium_carterae.2
MVVWWYAGVMLKTGALPPEVHSHGVLWETIMFVHKQVDRDIHMRTTNTNANASTNNDDYTSDNNANAHAIVHYD